MSEAWMQVIAIIGSNLVIMLTFFGISISLHNGMRQELNGIREDMKDFHEAMKDFHGKLCAIEERSKK